MSRSTRFTLAAACTCLLVIVVLVWAPWKSGVPDAASDRGKEGRSGQDSPPHQGGSPQAAGTGRPRERVPAGKSFDQVESILTDQAADDATTAIRLLDLSGRSDVSLEERIEALSHAVLLTPDSEGSRLVALARQDSLAPEMAEILLSDFHNRPDPTRLAGAVALARNRDQAIRSEAMDLVRFLIDEPEPEGDDSRALKKAEAKLKE